MAKVELQFDVSYAGISPFFAKYHTYHAIIFTMSIPTEIATTISDIEQNTTLSLHQGSLPYNHYAHTQ